MKNYLIGIVFLLAAFYLLWQQGEVAREQSTVDTAWDGNQSLPSNQAFQPTEEKKSLTGEATSFNEGEAQEDAFEVIQDAPEEELFEGMANEYSTLQFTNYSGGLRKIDLNEFERLSRQFSMEHSDEPFLALAFEDDNGNLVKGAMGKPIAFELIEKSPDKVIYSWESGKNLRIQRTYTRNPENGYQFNHSIVITNIGSQPLGLERLRLNLGSAIKIERMYNPFDYASTYLNVGYYNSGPAIPEGCSCATCSGRIDGEKDEFIQANEMGPSGRMETRYLSQARWACVNNQFFVNLIRPKTDMSDVRVSGQSIRLQGEEDPVGVKGAMSFPVGLLQPGASKEYDFEVYAGPKDYMGLKSLGADQKKVMQFGIFWWISEPLSWALNFLSGMLGSYGLGIIVLTIIVKLILWPLTAQATRSQKKMQSLQGPMAKLREKHKGNSQKLNQEMMKFYKENKVNPFAGCWPILVQIPIFLGMFWMLRSAAELYGQSFLWAEDLSEQDNISMLYGFSLNLLPIVMVATQWFQMKLNPMQMGPEMSEAQRINAKMMRFMPFMFLVFLYFFSSPLVLYWTVQNLMTIFQTLITKKEPVKGEVASKGVIDVEGEDDDSKPRTDRIELSDEERKSRNLLGLRMKGAINPKELEKKYKERASNYSDKRLSEMNAAKRRQALDKKDRLDQAHEFLKNLIDKDS
ncbi:MAG: hypothetical protein CMP11_00795 [Zetaproteobacteria bacterium]|nr:hypothetical protein [Pseudobdellovibrionaceae bacterium]